MEKKHFTKSLGITAGILIPFCIVVINGYFFIQKLNEEKPWQPEKELYNLGEDIKYGPITFSDISFMLTYGNSSADSLNEKIKNFNIEVEKLRKSHNFEYESGSLRNFLKDPLQNEELQTDEFKRLKKENEKNKIELLKTQLSAIKLTIKN